MKINIPVQKNMDYSIEITGQGAIGEGVGKVNGFTVFVPGGIKGEIINLGGNERLSRYELGEILCEEAGLDKNLLVGKTMDESGIDYKVADVSLNTDKLKSYDINPKSVREAIREILSHGS